MSFTLNPFTLLRRLFMGKTLDEIINFDKKRQELMDFFDRTERQVQAKAKQIEKLAAENLVHTGQMDQAKLLSDNLKTLMTQVLGKPTDPPTDPPVEPTHEAV